MQPALEIPFGYSNHAKLLGPVVQSVVSLTSSLRIISLTVLADSVYNILKFFAEKCEKLLHCKSYSHFFQQKISAYLRITQCKFNESLTNDIVSFEQLGPGVLIFRVIMDRCRSASKSVQSLRSDHFTQSGSF